MPEDAIPLFISFCIEQFKDAQKISGKEAMEILLNHGVIDYLTRNYEVLHTQSPQWLLEEINEFINNHPRV